MSLALSEAASRPYRSRVDLVASDEMLAMLLRGLARLRAELQAAEKRRDARHRVDVPAARGTTETALREAVPAVNERVWYYADDGCDTSLAAPAVTTVY